MTTIDNGLYDVPAGKMAVIITHLEMLAKPPIKEVPLAEGLTFRKITPTLEAYRDIFTRVGTQDWLWAERLKIDDAALTAILENPSVEFFTLTKDGTDEALLELNFSKPNTCELSYFGLTSALIGTGAGRYLMNQAVTRAWAADTTRMHLYTCTSDSPQAMDFYLRTGFVPFKRQVEIADDPRLTGAIPRTSTPKLPII